MGFLKKYHILFLGIFACFVFWASPVSAAKLLLSPSSGTFTVGSTFDVDILLNTAGVSVNTISATISFPADKLQLVSPTIGQSVISIWTAQPVFNNQTGTVKLTGGVPNGINVQSGLITSLTFRVKQPASPALVKFSDESRVLANDGNGTDVLTDTQNGVYDLVLPPPQGPVVSSETHPDQSTWYSAKDVVLRWASTSAVGNYSYALDRQASTVPDDISEGGNTTAAFKNAEDGQNYFHIKSYRGGIWGGVTTFMVNIDSESPAEFPIAFTPSNHTTSKNQIINFQTSDRLSGVSRYEIKIIPLDVGGSLSENNQNIFIEAASPYQLALDIGSYDIIVRAYDKAENYRDSTGNISVVTPLFGIISDRGVIMGNFSISWTWVWAIFGMMAFFIAIMIWRIERWHHHLDGQFQAKPLPDNVRSELEILNTYRKKYGNLVLLFVMAGALLFFGGTAPAMAVGLEANTPTVSEISRVLSNGQVFYAGGRAGKIDTQVAVYLQNQETGEVFGANVIPDKRGDWFYRHPDALAPGEYLFWAQEKSQAGLSLPSQKISVEVVKTGIQLGLWHVGREVLYLASMIVFLCMMAALVLFMIYRVHHARKKRHRISRDIRQAEESIRRGFALLRKDVESQLVIVRKAKLSEPASTEFAESEIRLLEDLAIIQQRISKEIWDVENLEQS